MKLKIYRNAHVYHNEDTQKYRDVVDLEGLRAWLEDEKYKVCCQKGEPHTWAGIITLADKLLFELDKGGEGK